ncbi:MAG TPA: hypothetical protein VH025_11890 [Solirubrobacteraceae bacterium]|nr:hypothetical protein [Solirubrobacteraceae bacterium]
MAVVIAVLAQTEQRRSGADMTPFGAFVAVLKPGERACQGAELLPADTSDVRMTFGTYGHPGVPMSVVFRAPGGRELTSGTLRPPWREGLVAIPVTHVAHATENASVCVRNEGGSPVAIAGAVPDPGFTMKVGSKTIDGRLRYEYLRPGRESWFSLLPTVVHRSTLAKSGLIRHWAWAGALLLMLAAVALGSRTIVREGRA